jgi:hypothetical protein
MNDGPQAQGNPPGWQGVRWDGPKNSAAAGAPSPAPQAGALARFLGGSPFSVFMRLLVMSLVVGALLIWLDIHPYMIFHALERFVQRIWYMGFDAIREIASYIVAGAVIVVPIWLLLRLMNMRGR